MLLRNGQILSSVMPQALFDGFLLSKGGSRHLNGSWALPPGVCRGSIRIYLPQSGGAAVHDQRREWPLVPGQILLFHGLLGLGRRCQESAQLAWLHLDLRNRSLDRRLQAMAPCAIAASSLTDSYEQLHEAIRRLDETWSDAQRARTQAAIWQCLAVWLTTTPSQEQLVDPKIQSLCEWLDRHACQRPTLEQCARQLGCSVPHLHRHFRAATGTTPLRYAEGVRMQLARRLLGEDNLRLPAIAARCGYPDLRHFSRVFSQQHGCSPGRWRQSAEEP